MSFSIVTTTSESRNLLEEIAHRLVKDQLAACCQIMGPHTSIYRWQDKIETATEWMCLIKTRREHFAAIERTIRELHTYEVPEIIATDISQGSDNYLKWLWEETQGLKMDAAEM